MGFYHDYGLFRLVEVTRLELAASASRTQRSTKLSHTSNYKYLKGT